MLVVTLETVCAFPPTEEKGIAASLFYHFQFLTFDLLFITIKTLPFSKKLLD